ncbi:MAG TPA: NAD(P)/FAD-dependent oxidoreductase [Nitrospirae bacterium]|nr:NAD(P)/FAD-dependent oxidoreductase [Nitrospirota bacterium]
MSNTANKDYDVIIIGAGIGGLVCGCYLAKAGMKVLIVEQHHKPGGYCTSFKRNGFTFDAAAHSFGSYREGGNMRRVLDALDLDKRIEIKRYDPSDIIISPDYKITFWADTDRTVEELQQAFPEESESIRNFIRHLTTAKPIDFAVLRRKTFKDFLDRYFQNDRLKAIISIPILGNGALPPSLISAFTGSKIFTEFLLDGGYYAGECMQALPDALAERFKELGGTLKTSCLVKKIKVRDNEVEGVVLEKGNNVSAKYVVSNADARQTFFELLGSNVVEKDILHKIDGMVPSLSIFTLYLGIDRPPATLPKAGTNVWFLPNYNLEDLYLSAKNMTDDIEYFMMRFSPDKKTILAFANAPFRDRKFWYDKKLKFIDTFIRKIETTLVPGLSTRVVYKDAATPYTLYRYTLNYKGAAYGWATFPSQLFTPELKMTTPIKGLFLTGHWTTHTQGIPGVAYLGCDAAKLILKKERTYKK